ncbi:MAG: glycosyltransferase [Desulfobacterales bacterium]|nr:glycosyltransferase [Desulfobacterales bacterium]
MVPVSIITPSFQKGRFIERTIQSVLDQAAAGMEYVVVDGGSTDQTVEVLKRYDSRIRWLSEKDDGQADAVNKGIRMTRGEIIGWLNADDIYYPGAISTVLAYFKKHPEVDIVYGDADHIDEDDQVLEPYYTEDWDYERLKDICFICQPAVFFRRRLVERIGLLDRNLQYCMDYEYWLRAGRTTDFVRLNQKLAGSRMYDDNKTLGERLPVHKEINRMFKQRFRRIPDKWLFAYAHVFTEEMGFDRTIHRENIKFILVLVCALFGSCMRWRQPISMHALKTAANWLAGIYR